MDKERELQYMLIRWEERWFLLKQNRSFYKGEECEHHIHNIAVLWRHLFDKEGHLILKHINENEASEQSFHDLGWSVTEQLIKEMVAVPYDENHNVSFMLVTGNDRLNDVEVHGNYNMVADILFEHAKKDIFLLEMLKRACANAEQWLKQHPIESEVDDDDYNDDYDDAILSDRI